MENAFCPAIPAGTRLIETFAWSPQDGAQRIELHRARMARSAGRLGFEFLPADFDRRVAGLAGEGPLRCRMTLQCDGALELTTARLAANPARWRVAIADQRIDGQSFWRGHKTTQRQIYDQARHNLRANLDELLFLNQAGQLCEGSISNVFLRRPGDSIWRTPDVGCGLLPGVLRQFLLQTGQARTAVLTLDDLQGASELACGNSLRGLIPAELVAP